MPGGWDHLWLIVKGITIQVAPSKIFLLNIIFFFTEKLAQIHSLQCFYIQAHMSSIISGLVVYNFKFPVSSLIQNCHLPILFSTKATDNLFWADSSKICSIQEGTWPLTWLHMTSDMATHDLWHGYTWPLTWLHMTSDMVTHDLWHGYTWPLI